MNYNDYQLSEQTLKELRYCGCNAATMSEAIEWIDGAFEEPISWDDEENPTEVGVNGDSVYCELKDHPSMEAFLNYFVLQCCYEIEYVACNRWDREHTEWVTTDFCGSFSDKHEASSIVECINEYYGDL